MAHPRRAYVQDVVPWLEVLVVEVGEGGASAVVDVVHEARLGVEVGVGGRVLALEVGGAVGPLGGPLMRGGRSISLACVVVRPSDATTICDATDISPLDPPRLLG